ncbi:hypothetical protein BU993_06540 [Flavobacterium columnare]|nr:hypothetical protein BU993_06540 [Flavobacterium columnare]
MRTKNEVVFICNKFLMRNLVLKIVHLQKLVLALDTLCTLVDDDYDYILNPQFELFLKQNGKKYQEL